MTINEQTYRDFRLFYRGLKNSNGRLTGFTAEWAAEAWLAEKFPQEESGLAVAYLVNGPRCDGDVLTIHAEG